MANVICIIIYDRIRYSILPPIVGMVKCPVRAGSNRVLCDFCDAINLVEVSCMDGRTDEVETRKRCVSL